VTGEAASSRLRGDGRGWTLLAIALGWVFVLGSRFLLPSVLPQVTDAFSVGEFRAGVAVTVIWAAYAVMQFPAGLLVDRLGERRLLVGSLLLTGGSVLLIGLSPVFLVFLVGCGAFGLATGLYGPARGTALSRTFPDNDGAAIGATLAAGSVGSAVLPFAAGALVGTVDWRLVVGGLLVPLLVAGTLVSRFVDPRSGSTTDGGHDESTTDGGRDESTTDGGHDESTTDGGHDEIGVRNLAGDVARALQIRGVVVGGVAVALMLFAFQGVSTFYVTYLVDVRSYGQTTAAVLFALVFVGAAVAQFVGGSLADRFGERWVLVGTAAVGAPVLAVIPYVEGLVPLVVLSLALGTRLAVAPVSNAYIIAILPDAVTGTAWGALRSAFFLLGAGGSTVVGAMAEDGLFAESFLLLAGLTGLAALVYLFLPARAAASQSAAGDQK
jgi:predicted MFS family arabinose efflux permease